MGLLEKTLGLVGGLAVATSLLGNKKKQLAELDTEFARTTADYQAKKSKLELKIKNGNLQAQKKLEVLEREYFVEKAEYENKRKTLLPKKSKVEEERETKKFEHQLDIEKNKAIHELDIEKTKTVFDLELEKDKNHHNWNLETKKTIHTLELEKDKSIHELNLDEAKCLHSMEMEKIEKASKLGFSSNNFPNTKVGVDNIICSSCGNKNTIQSKFCSGCGSPLNTKKFCSNCGTSLEANFKFCPACATPIEW